MPASGKFWRYIFQTALMSDLRYIFQTVKQVEDKYIDIKGRPKLGVLLLRGALRWAYYFIACRPWRNTIAGLVYGPII